MSEKIVASNLHEVIQKNKEIHSDMMQKALLIRTNWNRMPACNADIETLWSDSGAD